MARAAVGGQATGEAQGALGYDMKPEVVTLPVRLATSRGREPAARAGMGRYATARQHGSTEAEAAADANRYMADVKHVVVTAN